MRSFNRNLLVFVQLLFVYIFQSVFAVVPLGILRIFRSQHEIFVSPASFATELPYDEFSSEYYKILELQGDSKLGCDTSTMKISNDFVSPFLLLIARGNCTFETKALNAQKLGASGVIIYNTIEGLYRNSEVAPPGEYECKNGLGYVQDIYYPVYGKQMIDTIPDSCTNDEKCASNTCVITKLNKLNNQGSKVCCAWDLYLSMGVSSTEDIISVNIPTVYIRLEDYRLLSADRDLQNGMMQAKMFSRPMYAMTIASFLVWCIAVGTLIIGSIKIASEEKMSFLSYKRNQFEQNNTTLIGNKSSDDLNDQFDSSSENSSLLSEGNIKFSKDTRASDNIVASHFQDIDSIMDDTLDISTSHAVGFVLTSSLFLIFLYFIDVYYIVVTIYLLCACVALFIVYFQPLLLYLKKGFGFISFQIQNVEVIDIIAGLLSISIAIIWFINTQKNWDWILQDLMGISVCILFLSTVRLPNLKVATVLLGLGFIYDIFFVFVSAFIFKSSIMLKVASGEEYTEESENFCEKYPNDFTCKKRVIPMLLAVPAFSDFLLSESMLGLGDIVMPGLLIIWAARYDVRRYGYVSLFSKGYFPMCILGYALGLGLADEAVAYFNYGQPALLYIVPFILGPTLWRSYREKTLNDLWINLPILNQGASHISMQAKPIRPNDNDKL